MVAGNKISGEQLSHENPKIINTGKSHLNYQLMYVDTSNREQQYHKNKLSTEKIDRVKKKRCRTNEQDFCQNARIDKNTHRISSNNKYFQPQYEKKQNHILVRNLLKKSHKIQRSRRKEQPRGYSQIKTEPPQILRQDLLSYHNLNTKIILPPVLTLPDQGGKNKAIGSGGKNKPQSTNKNVKLKLKKTEQEEQQIGLQGIKQMVQNNLSGVSGRMQFLTKAKKILAEKKLLQKIGVHGKMMEVTVNQRIVTHNTIPKT